MTSKNTGEIIADKLFDSVNGTDSSSELDIIY